MAFGKYRVVQLVFYFVWHCAVCGAEVRRRLSQTNPHRVHIFCSPDCQTQWRRSHRNAVIVECAWCHLEVARRPSMLVSQRYFCGSDCQHKWQSKYMVGDRASAWRGGRLQVYTSLREWRQIRKQVLERDDHRCVICGVGDNLHVHHILSYREAGKHEVDNLITLCRSCHRKTDALAVRLDSAPS